MSWNSLETQSKDKHEAPKDTLLSTEAGRSGVCPSGAGELEKMQAPSAHQ